MNNYENVVVYKILLLGGSYVGKTGFLSRYINGYFSSHILQTIGISPSTKYIQMNDYKRVKLNIFDTSGGERFRFLPIRHYNSSDAIILFYDITEKKSFDILFDLIKDIKKEFPKNNPIFLVGNKKDDEEHRVITKKQGELFAKEYGLMFTECSAKTGENVDFIFNQILLNLNYLKF